MEYTDEQIRDLIKELTKAPVMAFWATVKAVNKESVSCTVAPDDESPELEEVLIKADLETTAGMIEWPTVGSRVICHILNNDPDTAYVAKTTEVEETWFNGGEQEGLVLHGNLVEVLTSINNLLTAIKTAASNTVPEAGNGANSAFQAVLNQAIAALDVPLLTNLENKKIKQ